MPRDDSRPLEFALRQNQPNPYAEATTVRFDLPFSAYVELEVFDTQGRRVRTLVREDRGPGYHAVNWNNRDDVGNRVRPGVYLYRIKAGTFASERKMVVKP
jgi:flagellar hook assembly protein FlgD